VDSKPNAPGPRVRVRARAAGPGQASGPPRVLAPAHVPSRVLGRDLLQAGLLQAGLLQAGLLQADLLQAGLLQAGPVALARPILGRAAHGHRARVRPPPIRPQATPRGHPAARHDRATQVQPEVLVLRFIQAGNSVDPILHPTPRGPLRQVVLLPRPTAVQGRGSRSVSHLPAHRLYASPHPTGASIPSHLALPSHLCAPTSVTEVRFIPLGCSARLAEAQSPAPQRAPPLGRRPLPRGPSRHLETMARAQSAASW